MMQYEQKSSDFQDCVIGTIYTVPVDKISLTGVRVRPVKTQSAQYLELVEDIRLNGVLQPIDCYVQAGVLYLQNGGNRVQACRDLGIQYINVMIIAEPQTDLDNARAQISKNLSIRSKLAELIPYIKAEILAGTSVSEIAAILGKTEKSIYDMCKIKNENPLIARMLDEGVSTVNVLTFNKEIELIKCLPEKEQNDLINLSKNTEQKTFGEIIALKKRTFNAVQKEKKQAEKDIKDSEPKVDKPIEYPILQVRLDKFLNCINYPESPYYKVWLYITGQAESIGI